MISRSAFADPLERHGFKSLAGVPCSLIDGLIAILEAPPRDVAIGLAAVACPGSQRPAVLMQNSGLGTSLIVKVTTEEAAVSRIPYPPAAIRDRFRASLGAR